MKRALAPAIAALAAGCGASTEELPPLGEVKVYVDTDAPMPGATASVAGLPPPAPLFDRLRVDITPPPGATCGGLCSREFDVDTGLFAAGSVSFGVLPQPGAADVAVEVRLFRASAVGPSGIPPVESTLDATFTLPPVAAEGLTELTVRLPTDSVGQPATVQPEAGGPLPSAVGTWPGAARIPCTSPPRDPNARCIPGGAFWMGNLLTAGLGYASDVRERIVVVSPFWLDAAEVTVADYGGFVPAPLAWMPEPPASEGSQAQDWCTFTPPGYTPPPGMTAPPTGMPLNCLTRDEAASFCGSRGGGLPSEAQFEYAASGLAGSAFVWGDDDPDCLSAVWGIGTSPTASLLLLEAPCRPARGIPTDAVGGPLLGGSSPRDTLTTEQGSVVDLAGNLSEWVKDLFNPASDPDPTDDPCWAAVGVYTDPVCTHPSGGPNGGVTYRGGSWGTSQQDLLAAGRGNSPLVDVASPFIGFRCAWPDGP